jgi:hypothetical protein
LVFYVWSYYTNTELCHTWNWNYGQIFQKFMPKYPQHFLHYVLTLWGTLNFWSKLFSMTILLILQNIYIVAMITVMEDHCAYRICVETQTFCYSRKWNREILSIVNIISWNRNTCITHISGCRLDDRGLIPSRGKDFYFLLAITSGLSGAHPVSYTKGTRASFL